MKNLKLFYLAFLAVSISFTSCKDDDDDSYTTDTINVPTSNAIKVSNKQHNLSNGYALLNDNDPVASHKTVELFLASPEFDGNEIATNENYSPTKNGDLISMIIKVDNFEDFKPNKYSKFSITSTNLDYDSFSEAVLIYAININLAGLFNEIKENKLSREASKLKLIKDGSLTVKHLANDNYEIQFSGKDMQNQTVSFNFSGALPTFKASEFNLSDSPWNVVYSNPQNLILNQE